MGEREGREFRGGGEEGILFFFICWFVSYIHSVFLIIQFMQSANRHHNELTGFCLLGWRVCLIGGRGRRARGEIRERERESPLGRK